VRGLGGLSTPEGINLASAWDSGSFANDDADDFLAELEVAGSLAVAREALKVAAAAGDEYLEIPEAARAIVAAEAVAALSGAPARPLPGSIRTWLDQGPGPLSDNLRALALDALERVRTESELQEVWEEAGATEWLAALAELESRLGQGSPRV
jgi:hypothetical protein